MITKKQKTKKQSYNVWGLIGWMASQKLHYQPLISAYISIVESSSKYVHKYFQTNFCIALDHQRET